MSGRWVQDCKKILDQIKTLETEGKDRLEMVGTIRFILYALQRSLSGWIEWINNPNIMVKFSREDLQEISKNLAELTQPFIEYDCKITSSTQEEITIRDHEQREEPKPRDIFYVT